MLEEVVSWLATLNFFTPMVGVSTLGREQHVFPVASAGSPAVRCRQAQASRKVWPAARARPLLPPSPQTMGLKTGLPLRSVGSDSRRVPPRRAQVGPCRVLRAFLAVGIRAVCQWPLGPSVSILLHFFGMCLSSRGAGNSSEFMGGGSPTLLTSHCSLQLSCSHWEIASADLCPLVHNRIM